jgi:hypothetical protein
MFGTLEKFKKTGGAVVVDTGYEFQIEGPDTKIAASRVRLGWREHSMPEEVIQGLLKRYATGATFLLHTLQHIHIECDGGSDAHDASSLASLASLQNSLR